MTPPELPKTCWSRTRELARAVLARDARFGWALLENPSRLRLLTIDSLNQSLAKRLPVLSGIGAGLGIEENARKLYELAAERLLLHLPDGTPRDREAVATLLAHVDNDVRKFTRLAAEMLARREAWLPELPADVEADGQEAATRRELEHARGLIVRGHLQRLHESFPPSTAAGILPLHPRRGRRAVGGGPCDARQRLVRRDGGTGCRAGRRRTLVRPGVVPAHREGHAAQIPDDHARACVLRATVRRWRN